MAEAMNAEVDSGTETPQGALDKVFGELLRPHEPGMAVGIYRNGRAAYLRGFGLACLEHQIPMTPRTTIHVASVSKQFTAFAIALLAHERQLDLHADVREYVPSIPDLGHGISVLQLVYHTAGLRDQWRLFDLGGQSLDNRLRQQQVLKMVQRQRALNFDPGTEHLYSNTGYTLMAEIVRAVSGRSFRQFTTERIFQTLGMSKTFFYDDVTEVVPGIAQSYRKAKDGLWHRVLLNYDNVGSTNLFTTAEDMVKWAGNFARPQAGDVTLIRKISQMGSLRDGTPINYGFGLTRRNYAGQGALVHFGGDAAFSAVFAYFPAADLGISLLANHEPADWDQLIHTVAGLSLGKKRNTRDRYAPAESTSSATLTKELVGHYVSEFEPLISLECQGENLMWRNGGGEPRPVVIRADGSLDRGNAWRTWYYFHPVRDTNGRVVALEERVSRENGKATIHKRIEPVAPGSAQLAELVGDYRSSELDITYTFGVEDGRLVAHSLWSPQSVIFTPSLPDRFDSDHVTLSVIVVVRDDTGKPVAMRLHGNRIRNILLERVCSETSRGCRTEIIPKSSTPQKISPLPTRAKVAPSGSRPMPPKPDDAIDSDLLNRLDARFHGKRVDVAR